MRHAEARQVAKSLFSEHKNPFGAFSLSSETHHTVTIPDAVRRCRWIAVDLNASHFALFSVGPSVERSFLAPCFDSQYPNVAAATKLMTGEQSLAVVKHARASTVPCWWSDGPECASSTAFESLAWSARTQPLSPSTCGLVFPVQADRGQCGMVVFTGPDITLSQDGLFDIHARCFTLFEAAARMRPGESANFPTISKRELECLKLTANGYTSEEIARLLKLSVHTANQYLTNTTQKLQAVNRTHAVAKALRMGLIE